MDPLAMTMSEADPTFDAITTALCEHGPATGPELATLLDAHPATVERHCRELQQSGRIRLVTGGRYAITAESRIQPRTAGD